MFLTAGGRPTVNNRDCAEYNMLQTAYVVN